MADQGLGRRASDQMAAKNATEIAVMDSRLKMVEEETARNRSFRHETNATLQKLMTMSENMAEDVKALLGLSQRVSEAEAEQATFAATNKERYDVITAYLADSKTDRAAISAKQDKIDEKMNKVPLYVLGVCIAIIAAMLWRFGLPPMS